MNRIVNKIVSKYHSRNPIDIAQRMNIKVAYADLGENVHGFYQYYKRGMVIYINSSLDEFMQLQVLRHEIGHAVLHRKTNRIFMERSTFQVPDKYENEADLFATFLAISDDDVCEYISNEYTVQQISNMTGCKEKFIEQRIRTYCINNEVIVWKR